jgi:hypothetical protein
MNPKDAVKQLTEMGCKYLRIASTDGDVVLYQNPAKDSSPSAVKAQADKIVSYIQKAPAGTYIVQGRTSPQARPTSVPVVKDGEGPQMAGPVVMERSPEVLSYSQALKMQEEIANLRAENARLLALVESLECDIEDMQTMADDAEPAAANPMMEQLAGMAAVLPALVDRYFENQKEARELERQKLAAMYQGRPQQPNPTQSYEGY